MNILPEIAKEKDYIVSVRRHLHKNPELSLKEYATATYIEEQLESMGIECRRVGETGVLGIIEGPDGGNKSILLRAETDALPILEETGVPYQSKAKGVMHACGHDVHTASLLGAAKVLQQSFRGRISGRVLLVFQPAEEFGHGSHFFLKENISQNVDRAFGFHVSPDYPVGTIAMTRGADNASCDYFKITIRGKAAHISKPHQGIDALYIASLLVTKLKTLSQQVADPLESALIGVGKITSGTHYNIIAEEAVIEGTTRTFSYETQELLKQKVTELADVTAAANGGRALTEFETFTCALINDDEAYEEVEKIAAQTVGENNLITERSRVMGFGSDDFAEYLRVIKGVYVHVGTSNKNHPGTMHPLHSSKFDIDEQALLITANLYAAYTLSVLNRGQYPEFYI